MLMACAYDSLVPSPLRETWSGPSNMHKLQPHSPSLPCHLKSLKYKQANNKKEGNC